MQQLTHHQIEKARQIRRIAAAVVTAGKLLADADLIAAAALDTSTDADVDTLMSRAQAAWSALDKALIRTA